MDSILMYAITLFTLPLSLLLIFLIQKVCKRSSKLFPPGSSGLPFLGENLHMAFLGSEKFLTNRMKKYSADVFQTSILGERMAIFCGPQGNKFLFSNENKLFTSWWPKSVKKVTVFSEISEYSVLKDESENSEYSVKDLSHFIDGFLRDFLKPEALRQYIPIMDAMAREHIEKNWVPHQQVKVFPLARKYTFNLACRLFMNLEDPTHIKALSDKFHLMTYGMFSVPIDLPGTAYNGSMKGGKMVRDELLKIIRARRKELTESQETQGHDLLFRLLHVTDEKEQFVDEKIKKICINMIALLVASYETTSSAVTFVLKHLAEHPNIYNQVLKEQMEIAKTKGPDDLLTWKDIEKMKYSWNVARESLRVTPPAQGSFGEAITDFTYAGFTIPKGWKTFWNVYTTHKNPKYFPKPEKFDPTRFEGNGPIPYTFVPFGGGPHMCPGKEFARLVILVFMYNIVTRFKLQIVIPNEKITYLTSPVPVKGLPLRLFTN